MQLRGKVFLLVLGVLAISAMVTIAMGGCVLSKAPGIVGVWKGLSSDGGELIFTFRSDGTFVQSYKGQADLPPRNISGTWAAKSDTAFILRPYLEANERLNGSTNQWSAQYDVVDEQNIEITSALLGSWRLQDTWDQPAYSLEKVDNSQR